MLQELKGVDCPEMEFRALGYHCAAVTQKAYNGVAILSKKPAKIILDALPGDKTDVQARYLETEIDGIRVIDIYLPNGNPVPGEKFDYKLKWMSRLKNRLAQLRREAIPFCVGGD